MVGSDEHRGGRNTRLTPAVLRLERGRQLKWLNREHERDDDYDDPMAASDVGFFAADDEFEENANFESNPPNQPTGGSRKHPISPLA
ncbi:hypothetical protein E2562_023994 [Oryza meyeriana var. granulata]|uniref:Uncharacterized protein n=1 Tax=Oryza meyeriana var. granulata TaxID=110450 RepID=A0A6G1EC98_9ORYZ|nr:hypothetical protein E2562_023994 [Oryza meyeriana var. granulata]